MDTQVSQQVNGIDKRHDEKISSRKDNSPVLDELLAALQGKPPTIPG